MRKIDIITFADLDIPTGVNKVIENMELGKNKFLEMNIIINNIIGSKNQVKSLKRDKNIRRILINILNYFANKNSWIMFIFIYLKYIYRAKKVIVNYLKIRSTSDTIIFHDIFSAAEYINKVKNRKKMILVLHTNGETFNQIKIYYKNINNFTKRYLENMEEKVIKFVDKIVFVSNESAEFYIRNKSYLKSKIRVIYNGIEDINYQTKQINYIKKLKFVCVGTINGRKGQDLILKVVEKLKKEIENYVEFYIIGEGPKYNEYKETVLNKNLDKIINVLGKRKDIKELLKKMDIFILPSYDEGLPIAIIEAMRAGLPIIATKVGGIPEMVQTEREGILINPNTKELEKVLLYILKNKDKLQAMSQYSRKKYEKDFKLEKMIEKYGELINE